MTEEQRYLRAVCERPDDYLPRLAYADWLDENGQGLRAELIRVMCEHSALGECGHVVSPPDFFRRGEEARCRRCDLAVRKHVILRYDGYPANWVYWAGKPLNRIDGAEYDYRRGFVHSVRLRMWEFMDHAAALFARHPITEVAITDRNPDNLVGMGVWYWWRDGIRPIDGSNLPVEVMRAMDEINGGGVTSNSFLNKSDALAALSAACVLLGRKAADLPPLESPS